MNTKAQIKIRVILLTILLAITIIAPSILAATNVCCEKTINGAWCQNTLEENCDTSINPFTNTAYKKTFSSCDATSFCKSGCCIDTDEGLCMENTPQRVCEQATGTWVDNNECNVPQCDLGCCTLGDQASFTTLTRCKKLSSFYNLETNFNQNIDDETSCILTAHLQDKGACVYESENQKTCQIATREQCINLAIENVTITKFHKDLLCSADELSTNCGPTTETICIPGKDEVYFKDTCGNPSNIYDASKIYSKNSAYWQKIIPKEETCGFNNENGNANSNSCGNCDYFKGSICSDSSSATYGENICSDLNCYDTQNGKDYDNGESWCIYQSNAGLGRDAVGSRHFRNICINGEEIVEPCEDFRNKICIENAVQTTEGNFQEAACRVNRWTDCIDQTDKTDCLNNDKRSCYWLSGFEILGTLGTSAGQASSLTPQSNQVFTGGNTGGFSGGITGGVITESGVSETSNSDKGICLPEIPPGLKFWEQGNANNICNIANTKCVVQYETGALTGFQSKPTKNKECLEDSWAEKMNNICTSLGDCGAYVNIAGKYTSEGAGWKINGEKKLLTGILNKIKQKAGV